MIEYEINDTNDLMRAIMSSFVGGYELTEVEYTQKRCGQGHLWLVVTVTDQEPNTNLSGEYWFWNDGKVMQVL